jgi:hypothetical protein
MTPELTHFQIQMRQRAEAERRFRAEPDTDRSAATPAGPSSPSADTTPVKPVAPLIGTAAVVRILGELLDTAKRIENDVSKRQEVEERRVRLEAAGLDPVVYGDDFAWLKGYSRREFDRDRSMGIVPKPDYYQGRHPVWLASTVRKHFADIAKSGKAPEVVAAAVDRMNSARASRARGRGQ